jgi:hypothetical protein
MNHSKTAPLFTALALSVVAGIANGQASNPSGSSATSAPAPWQTLQSKLRVQLVITRFEGEKKIASLPYTLVVTPGAGNTSIRLGVDTPIPAATSAEGSKESTIQYRTVGTNIDCMNPREYSGGNYSLTFNVENTAALPVAEAGTGNGRPIFRRFNTNFTAFLRDGQSMQSIASTDPVTGEVVKIDVTLNVMR